MPTTFDASFDEIFATFKTTWDADTPAVNGGVIPKVFYQGVGETGPQPPDAAWARISILHNLSTQAALSPENDKRRYTDSGIITVQVFTPIGNQGLQLNRQLAPIARKAFQGKRTIDGNIWFRNVAIVEVGADAHWHQFNVVSEFEYDEFN